MHKPEKLKVWQRANECSLDLSKASPILLNAKRKFRSQSVSCSTTKLNNLDETQPSLGSLSAVLAVGTSPAWPMFLAAVVTIGLSQLRELPSQKRFCLFPPHYQ